MNNNDLDKCWLRGRRGWLTNTALLVCSLILAACGGGGGGSGAAVSSAAISSASTASSLASSSASSLALEKGQFTNPLFSNGADPWLQFYKGNYYLTTTTWNSQVVMRKSPTLAGLANATPIYIWSDTAADRCCNFWAFEFHRLQGPNGYRWYLMYSAGNAVDLGGQKLRVLESAGDDPMGPYTFKATVMPDTWNIDGTYFQYHEQLYMLWSEWVGNFQSVWIAKMENPWTITGSKKVISTPTMAWEQIGGNTNEGPEVLQHDGRTFVTFSASSCNTPDYKLGMLELTGSDPLLPDSWSKNPEPVFQKTTSVFGPGHNGFFMSPDGSENWIVYHGNSKSTQGCGDTRAVRMQKFDWKPDGTPNFGEPAAPSQVINPPAGEAGPISVAPEGARFQLVNRNSGLCLSIVEDATADGGQLVQRNCAAASSNWVLDYTADGAYRLANSSAQKFAGIADCSSNNAATTSAWMNNTCQQWLVEKGGDAWLKFKNKASQQYLDINNCATTEAASVQQSAASGCQEWRLQPVGKLAILSVQSGKAVEVAGCSSANSANVDAAAWSNAECQKWTFSHSDSGYLSVSPAHNSGACLGVANASSAANANIAQLACDGNNTQWRLEPLSDGTFKFAARHSDLVMDLAACGFADGTNVAQYDWLNNNCQKYVLKPVQ